MLYCTLSRVDGFCFTLFNGIVPQGLVTQLFFLSFFKAGNSYIDNACTFISAQITILLAEIVESAQVGAAPVFLTALFSLTVIPRKHQNLWVATMKANLQLPLLILMERDALHFTEINPSSSIAVVLQIPLWLSETCTWNLLQMSFAVIILFLF